MDCGTFELWLRNKPEFLSSERKGRALADAEVARALYRKATGTWTQPVVKIATKIETLLDGTVVKSEHIVPYVEHFPPDTPCRVHLVEEQAAGEVARQETDPRNQRAQGAVTVELSPRARQHIEDLRQLLFGDDDQPSERLRANGPGPGNGRGVQ